MLPPQCICDIPNTLFVILWPGGPVVPLYMLWDQGHYIIILYRWACCSLATQKVFQLCFSVVGLMCEWHNKHAPVRINPVVTQRVMAYSSFTPSIQPPSSCSDSLQILWRVFLRGHLLLSGMWFHIWLHQHKYTAVCRWLFLSWNDFSLKCWRSSCFPYVWFNVTTTVHHMADHITCLIVL